MNVTIKLFAQASQLAGVSQTRMELTDDATVADLKRQLVSTFPSLSPLIPSLFVAINSEYADDQESIPEGAEVACFPPVSGG